MVLGALVAGSMLGATVGPAAAHDDWRGRGDHGREWYGPGRGGPDWRWERPHHRHWRERGAYYAPPPVVYAPPPVVYAPQPRVIYAPPPVVYAPQPVVPGFGLSVNIR
ncbi:hypothetical protein HUE56_02080 (plasmid) [Azospirillum oryzae]|uniref:PXPV repeat-containing protein n=1 Tax=Azospirillum oryzae TaxID=286727 RepID=A0A6N1AH04_9PROT|nr:hypothetical protein HUE56_02080 [Azospirillum oryzae]GLR78230.1 hypothetical protein GCM10007856_09010 [Azospirillum oryzae]